MNIPWCYNCQNFYTINKLECIKIKECSKEFAEKQEKYYKEEFNIGDKIYFKGEKKPYKIQACDANFIIATKPFNIQHTYLYVIVDLEQCIRGSDNRYCMFEYNNPKEAKRALKYLRIGELEVSRRNFVPLDIERIVRG